MLDGAEAIAARFARLSELIERDRPLWGPRPFVHLVAPWEADQPGIAGWLRGLSHEQIDAIETPGGPVFAVGPPAPLAALQKEIGPLCHLDPFSRDAQPTLAAPKLAMRIAARKWRQVRAFVEVVSAHLPPTTDSIIDWCCGKGHATRALSIATGRTVIGIERRADLCKQARQWAEHDRADTKIICADVLDVEATRDVSGVAVSLHACGALTDALFDRFGTDDTPAIFAVPCCYEALARGGEYVPRSKLGCTVGVRLSQWNLRLPAAHEAVARPATRTARRREMAFRCGLDLLIREVTGRDEYVVQGPFPQRAFRGSFEAFCRAAADNLQVELHSHIGWPVTESAGDERARTVRGLGLLRGLYGRPLELWLALDRALGLADRERPIQVGVMCDAALTPRNIMIASVLSAAA